MEIRRRDKSFLSTLKAAHSRVELSRKCPVGYLVFIHVASRGAKNVYWRQTPFRTTPDVFGARLYTQAKDHARMFAAHEGVRGSMPTLIPPLHLYATKHHLPKLL